ncbi:hypothetical protein BDR05DRAFT_947640 [Suillus weaverae]|nr:hypothetical protein BDR05DRAFT_947640 [Suillus weaverae]
MQCLSITPIQMTGWHGEALDIGGLLQHSMIGLLEILPMLASESTGVKAKWSRLWPYSMLCAGANSDSWAGRRREYAANTHTMWAHTIVIECRNYMMLLENAEAQCMQYCMGNILWGVKDHGQKPGKSYVIHITISPTPASTTMPGSAAHAKAHGNFTHITQKNSNGPKKPAHIKKATGQGDSHEFEPTPSQQPGLQSLSIEGPMTILAEPTEKEIASMVDEMVDEELECFKRNHFLPQKGTCSVVPSFLTISDIQSIDVDGVDSQNITNIFIITKDWTQNGVNHGPIACSMLEQCLTSGLDEHGNLPVIELQCSHILCIIMLHIINGHIKLSCSNYLILLDSLQDYWQGDNVPDKDVISAIQNG